MSALSIGRDRLTGTRRTSDNPAAQVLNRVTRWVPGDVLALFAWAITWLDDAGPGEPSPSVALLIAFVVVTPCVVLLGVWADSTRSYRPGDFVNAGMAAVAFVIASLPVPDSGWQRWALINEHPRQVFVVTVLAALLFALFASGVEKRIAEREELGDAE